MAFIQYYTEGASRHNKTRQRILKHTDVKEVKPTLFAGDGIAYILKKYPEESIKQVPELISKLNKFAGYKANTKKSIAV